jgi:hypothetical protein
MTMPNWHDGEKVDKIAITAVSAANLVAKMENYFPLPLPEVRRPKVGRPALGAKSFHRTPNLSFTCQGRELKEEFVL